MNYNRYKDREPKETIKISKKILDYFNLDYKESVSYNPLKNIYSSTIEIESLDFVCNGKGTTKEYCQASAYGELIELLFNRYFTRKYLYNLNNLFYDEIDFNIQEELSSLPYDIIEDLKTSFFESDNKIPNMNELIDVYQSRFGSNIIKSIPFYDVKNKDSVYLPVNIINSLAFSTGMSAGNTLEEAISQAICEIFERYVYTEIITKNLTPPIIPLDYVYKHCPEIKSIIEEYISEECDIYIFDCSLGKDFPVVAVMLIDKNNNSYKVNFGSHISFNIAIERCLTEMLQGYDSVNNLKYKMCMFSPETNEELNEFYTYFNRFRNNTGPINCNFFLDKSNWDFKEWNKEYESWNNKQIVQYLIEFCLTHSSNVYIRNNNCMGMYAVRVYIPRLSYIKYVEPKGLKTKCSLEQMLYLVSHSDNSIKLNNKELEEYKRIFECNIGRFNTLVDVDTKLLLAFIMYDLNNTDKMLYYLNLIKDNSKLSRIILHIIYLFNKNYSTNDIYGSILQKFYPNDEIELCFKLLQLQGHSFEFLLSQCKNNDQYNKKINNIKSFISKLSNYMSNVNVNQNDIKLIL